MNEKRHCVDGEARNFDSTDGSVRCAEIGPQLGRALSKIAFKFVFYGVAIKCVCVFVRFSIKTQSVKLLRVIFSK